MKPVKPRWKDASVPRLLSPTTLGILAQSLENGLKAEGLMRKTLKGTDAGFLKQAKQMKYAATIKRKKQRSTDQ